MQYSKELGYSSLPDYIRDLASRKIQATEKTTDKIAEKVVQQLYNRLAQNRTLPKEPERGSTLIQASGA